MSRPGPPGLWQPGEMRDGAIRNLAVGLPVKDGHVLMSEMTDRAKGEVFHRAVGGGIEFGERAEEALRREFREELDVGIERAELLAVVENLFTFEGRPGHEVVHVFGVESAALDAVPLDAALVVLDEGSVVRWVPVDTERPIYPDVVRELLQRK